MISIPIISGLIGYLTNYLAIKSLFYPRKKVLFFWGLLPKRQDEISKKISFVVEEYLFDKKDISKNLLTTQNKNLIIKRLKKIIDENLVSKIPAMFQGFAKPLIEDFFENKKEKLIQILEKEIVPNLTKNINIQKIVYEKLKKYQVSNLEKIIKNIANKELRFIEILGGILGFIIGVIQVLLFF